jgi:hypothetical protein
LSKKHGTEMFQAGDPAHLAAMNEMRERMTSTEAMQACFAAKKEEFTALAASE